MELDREKLCELRTREQPAAEKQNNQVTVLGDVCVLFCATIHPDSPSSSCAIALHTRGKVYDSLVFWDAQHNQQKVQYTFQITSKVGGGFSEDCKANYN